MTQPDRAVRLGKLVMSPVMRKMTEHVFGKCGNCIHRVQCSSQLVNMPGLFTALTVDELPHKEPGVLAENIAQVFKGSCAGCDQVEICVRTWAELNGILHLAPEVSRKVRLLGAEETPDIAAKIEGLMDTLRIDEEKMLSKVAGMWWNCHKHKKYETVALVCLKQVTK